MLAMLNLLLLRDYWIGWHAGESVFDRHVVIDHYAVGYSSIGNFLKDEGFQCHGGRGMICTIYTTGLANNSIIPQRPQRYILVNTD